MRAKRLAIRKEDVARLVDDIYRKMKISGATDLATKPQIVPDSTHVKPKEEIDDSPQVEMNIRCLCESSLFTESMIKVCLAPPSSSQASSRDQDYDSWQGGLSEGYKKSIAEKEITDDTYTEDGLALFRVQGSGLENMQSIQVEPVYSDYV